MKKNLLFIFVFTTMLCSFFNYGFLGTDEYWTGMTRYLPADTKNPSDFYEPGDVKSPLQLLPFWTAAKAASMLGADNAFLQYRWMLILLGLLHSAMIFWGLKKFVSKTFTLSFLTFYFLLYFPMLFGITRPMFESLAAPWVFLSGIFAFLYSEGAAQKKQEAQVLRAQLLWGVVFICIAFSLRPQVGLCALAFPIICIIHKKWRDLFTIAILGVVAFVTIGFLDGALVNGGFHPSLYNLITYNLQSGSEYGSQSLFTYPLLLLGFGFIPWLMYRGSSLFDKKYWIMTSPFWLMIFLFVLTHSLFAQKFERFLIPILPLYALALLPAFQHLWENRNSHQGRAYSLLGINGVLWIAATWFPAQGNIIELSKYLNTHPEITSVYSYKNQPDWITEVFIDHKISFSELKIETLPQICKSQGSRILIGEGLLNEFPESSQFLKVELKISTNPFDHLAYIINPSKNKRRSPLVLTSCI